MSRGKTVKEKSIKENTKNQNKKNSQFFQYETADIFSTRVRWFILGLIVFFVIVIRIRLLDIPLERDEGEYAYMGQLLLKGIAPYSAAYSMKLPGTYIMYAGIMSLFGQSARGIHLGFMILNCVTLLMIFYLSRKLVNDLVGVVASGAYAVLSLSSSVLGFAAHATHFVVLPAIGGTVMLLSAVGRNKPHLYFLSGIVFGLAFLMKQAGLFFPLFGLSYILYQYWSSKPGYLLNTVIYKLTPFITGVLLPFLGVTLWIYISGNFDKFWFWTVQYALKYASQVPLPKAIDIFKENFFSVVDGFYLLWIFSALGFAILMLGHKSNTNRIFIMLFAFFSFLSICPGFYFREHYFITFLPSASLSVGIFINYLCSNKISFLKLTQIRLISLGLFIVVVAIGTIAQKEYFFEDGPLTVARKIYGLNPFSESVEIAKFIKTSSNETDRVAVLGSEPQIYFYSNRRSATGYIYTYSLMESHDYALAMQKEMASEVESSRPKFIVAVKINSSWLAHPQSEKFIFDWLNGYIPRNYTLVGIADIISPDRTIYKWHGDASIYTVRSQNNILVFERR